MTEDDATSDLTLTAEISGPYDEVLARLQPYPDAAGGQQAFEDVVADLAAVLRAVRDTGGGIESDVAASAGVEPVEPYLDVLAAYDLVELDERTWQPGPALRDE